MKKTAIMVLVVGALLFLTGTVFYIVTNGHKEVNPQRPGKNPDDEFYSTLKGTLLGGNSLTFQLIDKYDLEDGQITPLDMVMDREKVVFVFGDIILSYPYRITEYLEIPYLCFQLEEGNEASSCVRYTFKNDQLGLYARREGKEEEELLFLFQLVKDDQA